MSKCTGFKGFDKDLKCRGYQYKIGEEHKHEGDITLCEKGFHFCEYPLDTFNFYPPPNSLFAEVEGFDVSKKTDSDTKRVCKRLLIKTEISFKAMVEAAIKFTFDRADWSKKEKHVTGDTDGAVESKDRGAASATGYQGAASATGDRGAASATGDRGAASATGDRGAASATGYQGAASATGDRGAASATGYQGAASATGDRGAASATGDRGAASATGEEGCAVALGIEGKVKGIKGTWLTAAEWEKKGGWHRIDVKTVKVDGEKIKADTFYVLKKGEFTEVI